MGKRGPPKTPTPVLERRGSWRAKTRPGEPQLGVELLDAPAALSEAAALLWPALAQELFDAGLSTVLDRHAMGRICECRAAIDDLQRTIDAEGRTAKGHGGSPIKHPAVAILHTEREQLLRLEKEFGMTPSSRAGVQAVPKKDGELVEGKQRFVKRKKGAK